MDKAWRSAPATSPRRLQVKQEALASWLGQVFGLVDMRARATRLLFVASQPGRASAHHEGRFHTPLRGSAGIGHTGRTGFPLNNIAVSRCKDINRQRAKNSPAG